MPKITAFIITLVTAASAAAAAGQSPPSAQQSSATEPYAMRGIRLGITLDEFREGPIVHDHGEVDLRLYCTGDRLPLGLSLMQDRPGDRALGVTTCEWFGANDYDSHFVTNLFIDLGEGAGSPAFDFIYDGTADRLFRIRFYANTQYAPAIQRGLTARYGAPVKITEAVQNGLGNTFTAATNVWANPASSITFESPCRRTDRYCLTYEHTALTGIFDRLVAQRAATAVSEKF